MITEALLLFTRMSHRCDCKHQILSRRKSSIACVNNLNKFFPVTRCTAAIFVLTTTPSGLPLFI